MSFCGKFPGPEADAQGLLCSEVLRDDAFTAESGYQRDTFACFAGRRGTLCSIPGPFVPLLAVEVPTDCSETIGTGQSMLIFAKMSRESQETAKTVPRVMWV